MQKSSFYAFPAIDDIQPTLLRILHAAALQVVDDGRLPPLSRLLLRVMFRGPHWRCHSLCTIQILNENWKANLTP